MCASDALVLTAAPPMYPLLFTSLPGMSRDGYLVGSANHVLWFESEDERDRFAASHFVAASYRPDKEG